MLSILLRQPVSDTASVVEALEKLETSATITKKQLLVTFRKNISGITQRLGEIPLEKNEDEEIDIVGWAATAAARSTDLEQEVEDLKGKYEDQTKAMEKLNRQLEDLIEAKNQHEQSLFERFRELLNAKKLKIRDLHRVLAGANIDPQKGQSPCTLIYHNHSLFCVALQLRESPIPRIPASSRSTKRKAKGDPTTDVASASSTDEEATSDKMSLDEEHARPQMVTPDRSDPSATDDETDDDLDSVPVSQPVKNEPRESASITSPAKKPARALSPPPRRELPFASNRQPAAVDGASEKSQSAASQQIQKSQAESGEIDDDDEETSDDEL